MFCVACKNENLYIYCVSDSTFRRILKPKLALASAYILPESLSSSHVDVAELQYAKIPSCYFAKL
jgi:hypothetical protein